MDSYPNAQQANPAPFTQDPSHDRTRKDQHTTTGNTHRINLSQSGSVNNINTLQIDDDDDDLENLPDDDLLLWTTAQFTFDENKTNIHDQQAIMALKLAQQQHQHQQNLQQQQHLQQNMSNHNSPQVHPLPYHNPAEMQRQLQQFDAIHRYLDGNPDGHIQGMFSKKKKASCSLMIDTPWPMIYSLYAKTRFFFSRTAFFGPSYRFALIAKSLGAITSAEPYTTWPWEQSATAHAGELPCLRRCHFGP